jgi:HlyD family secretion protein
MVVTTQGSGAVALPVQLMLPSPEAGYAAELYVEEGQSVEKGQLLARLDVPDLEDELEDLRTDLDDAKRDLVLSDAQDAITLDRKVREIDALEEDIQDQSEEVERIRKLVAINASRQSELNDAEDKLQDLKDQKEEKDLQYQEDRRLQELQRQSRQATIQKLETKINRLEERIADASIASPMDGDILEVDSTLAVPGSVIKVGQNLFTIADPSSAVVELEVDEEASSFLRLGQKVGLTVGGSTLSGSISSIGKVAQVSSDGLGATISIKVIPDTQDSSLLLGSTAVGEMELGVRPGVLLLPRGPYLTTGSQRYLYVVEEDTATRVEVVFGEVEGQLVEVLSGVEAGDEVIISGYQNYMEYETIKLEGGG